MTLTRPEDLSVANFDENTAATHEVVAAVAGKRVTVYEVWLTAAASTDVTFQSAATAKIGPVAMAAGDIIDKPANEIIPFVVCEVAEAFNIVLGTGSARVTGWIRYIQE